MAAAAPGAQAEAIVFDKAQEAEQRHALKQQAAELEAQIAATVGEARKPLADKLEQLAARQAALAAPPEAAAHD